MEAALRFLRDYEVWIYVILGALAAWQVRKFTLAWEELRAAAFGMERDGAQARLNIAAIWLVTFLLAAMAEFTVVAFVVPSVPGALPLPTPTLNLLITPTITLPAQANGDGTPQALAGSTTSVSAEIEANGCIPDQVILLNPQNGAEIEGVVTITGTADIPDFGFYKYEVARPGDPAWLPIQAGREKVKQGRLGDWDTRTLPAGEYLLRLVVTDNRGQALTPCVIRVQVVGSEQP